MEFLLEDLSLLVVIAALITIIVKIFRLPTLVGYLLAGIYIGTTQAIGVESQSFIDALSELGIVFLLFVLGMEINLYELSKLSQKLSISTFANFLIVSIISTIILYFFVDSISAAVLLGIGISFSSTLVVVKFLDNKDELDSTQGKLSVGILILQDIIAVVAIIVFSSVFRQEEGFGFIEILRSMILLVLLLGLSQILSYYIFPKILKMISKNHEELFIVALAWAIGVSYFVGIELGLGLEIGALLAGQALAHSVSKLEIIPKIEIIRNFFLIIFFISTGMKLDIEVVRSILIPGLIISLMVITIKPIIFYYILTKLKTDSRNAFLAGINLSQVSEFSLILAATGLTLGIIDDRGFALLSIVVLITFSTSSIMIKNSQTIYNIFFEIKNLIGLR